MRIDNSERRNGQFDLRVRWCALAAAARSVSFIPCYYAFHSNHTMSYRHVPEISGIETATRTPYLSPEDLVIRTLKSELCICSDCASAVELGISS